MIRVKSIFDAAEADDGLRVWVEPIGLTRDLQQWCDVDHVLPQLGPPLGIWRQLQEDPCCFDHFAAKYYAHLAQGPQRRALAQLAAYSARHALTLLHQGDDPYRNSATVLFEFLVARQEQAGS